MGVPVGVKSWSTFMGTGLLFSGVLESRDTLSGEPDTRRKESKVVCVLEEEVDDVLRFFDTFFFFKSKKRKDDLEFELFCYWFKCCKNKIKKKTFCIFRWHDFIIIMREILKELKEKRAKIIK